MKIALCSITQGAVLRVYMRSQESATFEQGIEVLRQLAQMPEVVFLQDNGDYLDVPPRGIRGHRQVTDAYLAQIAKKNDLTLATLDMAQTALYPDTCYYIS
jgi:predicted nucleic acid-binding protein